jgi:hypothetical protein
LFKRDAEAGSQKKKHFGIMKILNIVLLNGMAEAPPAPSKHGSVAETDILKNPIMRDAIMKLLNIYAAVPMVQVSLEKMPLGITL